MKPDCHPNELALYWTLSQDERALLANKTGATRLAFTLLLKLFQRDGRFPEGIVNLILAANACADAI